MPAYLERAPDRPLPDHDWCLMTGIVKWLVPLVWPKVVQGERRTVFTSVATRAVLNAAAAGMGVTAIPCYVGNADARQVRVADTTDTLTIELWIMTHPDLRHTAWVRALMTF